MRRTWLLSHAMLLIACLLLLRLPGSLALATRPPRAAGIASARACTPPLLGLVPPEPAGPPTQSLLFAAALADAAYVAEFGSSAARAPVAPCLRAWGAAPGSLRIVNATDAAGGQTHASLFSAGTNVFVLFRGLDALASVRAIELDTAPQEAAAYFGLANASAAATAAGRAPLPRIFALRGFLRAFQALEPPLMAAITQLLAEMPGPARRSARLWLVGHSDGSSLAQIAALRLARALGGARLAAVWLFGAQRVLSAPLAAHYDAQLGRRTLRWQYGWDPATEALYQPSLGVRLVGRGLIACPLPGAAVERLVQAPLGADVLGACGPAAPRAAADARAPPGGARGLLLSHLAHHFPAVFFDALLRQVGSSLSACDAAALALPQCVISSRCAAALRPAGAGCATCGSDEACGAGLSCDCRHPWWSGNLCWDPAAAWLPPGLPGLLGLW